MLLLRHPLRKVNDPDETDAFANGQLIMMRADVYREVGGHESVRSVLLEDIALARRVKEAGRRLRVAYGFDLAASRMYASFGALWRGWSRIFYSALRASLPRMMVSVLLLAVFTVLPYAALLYALVALAVGAADAASLVVLAVISAAAVVVMKALMVRLHRMTRCESIYVALHFPASLFALAVLVNAMARRFSSRGIEWKDTRYDTRGSARRTV
jgi:cellulose synthase/poly-beta-1,6-N-acetylglucosamine synthase-like glycosyltransferase